MESTYPYVRDREPNRCIISSLGDIYKMRDVMRFKFCHIYQFNILS